MDTISNTVWQRKGSCLIFNKTTLTPFLKQGCIVSLRQALSWIKSFPSDPPVKGKTILVCGLETMVETLPPDEIDDFLTGHIRPLLITLQNRWPACGIVFGFSSHPNTFKESQMREEVLFKRRDRVKVSLSEGIWGPGTALNMKRISDPEQKPGKEVVVGYYVARIS